VTTCQESQTSDLFVGQGLTAVLPLDRQPVWGLDAVAVPIGLRPTLGGARSQFAHSVAGGHEYDTAAAAGSPQEVWLAARARASHVLNEPSCNGDVQDVALPLWRRRWRGQPVPPRMLLLYQSFRPERRKRSTASGSGHE
jgi:hypothetical protein